MKVFLAAGFPEFLARNLLDHCYERCTAVHVFIEEMHTIYELFVVLEKMMQTIENQITVVSSDLKLATRGRFWRTYLRASMSEVAESKRILDVSFYMH